MNIVYKIMMFVVFVFMITSIFNKYIENHKSNYQPVNMDKQSMEWNTAANQGWQYDETGKPFEAYYCSSCSKELDLPTE